MLHKYIDNQAKPVAMRSPKAKSIHGGKSSSHKTYVTAKKSKSKDRTSAHNYNQVHNFNNTHGFQELPSTTSHVQKMNATVAQSLLNARPAATRQQKRGRISSRDYLMTSSRKSDRIRSQTLAN